MQLRLLLFGSPRVELDGSPLSFQRRKALALVVYMALTDGPHNRGKLATLFWPESDEGGARSSLRTILTALRRAGLHSHLSINGEIIHFRRENCRVDVLDFLEAVHSDSTPPDNEDELKQQIDTLTQAVVLYRDHFMAGFTLPDCPEFDQWQFALDDRLRSEMTDALQRLTQFHIQLAGSRQVSSYGRAIEYAQRWLEIDPINETAHRYLMKLYSQTDQRAAALRQYQLCVETLEKEMGIPPQQETTRLYEALKSNHNISLRDAGPRIYGSIPPMPELVIGREDDLQELKDRLGLHETAEPSGDAPLITVLQGWPGLGKTTLSVTLAYDPAVAARYPDGILWTSLGQFPNVLAELVGWGQALGDSEISRARTVEEVAGRLRARLLGRHFLLIVDDVWQPEHAAPFRVAGPGCAMLFTTRMNDVARALAPAAAGVFRLPILSDTRSLELLEVLAPEVVRQNPAEALELVQDLEGLPLAIQVAGRLLNTEMRMGWGVKELLQELREGRNLLDAAAPPDLMSIADQTTPTVAALLKYSTDTLDEDVRERFAYLGVFAPKPARFELEALKAVWEVDDPRPTIRTLTNRGLLEPIGSGWFQVHALLVMHARSMIAQ